MGQRLTVIGLVVAVIAAVLLFIQQQQTLTQVQDVQLAATEADQRRVTAVAMRDDAIGTQVQAEAGQATALAAAQSAGTAQAEADLLRGTAVSQAQSVATSNATIASGAAAQVETAQVALATAQADADQQGTLQAESAARIETAQAQIDDQATRQAGFDAALGTATAQVDLAEFARQAAEEDRATALAQSWILATLVSQQSQAQPTAVETVAQSTQLPTSVPSRSTPTPAPATEVIELSPTPLPADSNALTETFTTDDKRISIQHPSSWSVGEIDTGVLLLVSTRAIMRRNTNDLESGEVEIQLIVGSADYFRGVQAGAAAADVLQTVRDIFTSQGNADISDTAELKVGEYNAARFEGQDGNNAIVVTALDLKTNNYALSFTYFYPGEVEQFTPLMDEILASLHFTP